MTSLLVASGLSKGSLKKAEKISNAPSNEAADTSKK
jgi:hypothetical protein